MKTLKLLKDFGDYKAGELVDVSESDAKLLIADGTAELYITLAKHTEADPSTEPESDVKTTDELIDEAVKAAVDKIKASGALGGGERVPAQPKGEPKGYDFGERNFYEAVKSHDMGILGPYCQFRDNQMGKATGHSEAIDSDGGFLVPTQMSNDIIDAQTNSARIAPQCHDTAINNRVERPFVDDYDKSSSWYAGFVTYWVGEGTAPTKSKMKFGKYALQLKKVGVVTYGTEELIADSIVSFESEMSKGAGYSLAKEFDEQIVNGGGAALPEGLMNSNALVSVSKETDQPAATFETANALKMVARIANMDNAVWLINKSCYTQIYSLSLVVGTGGIPAMIVDFRDATTPRMLGIPIQWCEHCQILGTTGDIILTDLKQYNTASKEGAPGIKAQSSIHVKFLEGEETFRFTTRVDGQSMWKEALTTKHGSTGNTVSPIVALATRE